MIPIVTVTFTRDKWCMLLQAHSIEKFVLDPIIHYVIIEDDLTPFEEWENLLKPIYKKQKLVLLNKDSASNLFCKYHISGYVQQQYIKLKSSILLNDEYYLSLDSKNIIHKPFLLKNAFYRVEGSRVEGSSQIMDTTKDPVEQHESLSYWEPWLSFIECRYGLSRPEKMWFAGTPFLLKTDIVKNMIDTANIDDLFLQAIVNGIPVSEYLLYAYFSNAPRIHWSCQAGYSGNGLDVLKIESKNFYFFNMYRRGLSQDGDILIKFLLDSGLDEKYVIPAVKLTPSDD